MSVEPGKSDTYAGDKKTRDNKSKLLAKIFDCNGNVYAACKSLNLARSQFYVWLEDDKKFSQDYSDIKERQIDNVESNLFDLIFTAERDSDRIRASELYLKAHAKSRGYGVEKREQEHSGDLSVSNKVVIVKLPQNGREPAESN